MLATVSVLAIVASWNTFLLPLRRAHRPRQAGRCRSASPTYSTQYTTDTRRILAFTTLSMVPALVFYAFAERQLVGGLTGGAVKG